SPTPSHPSPSSPTRRSSDLLHALSPTPLALTDFYSTFSCFASSAAIRSDRRNRRSLAVMSRARRAATALAGVVTLAMAVPVLLRSEEHTSELQSLRHFVFRL